MSELIHLVPVLRPKDKSQARNPEGGLGRFQIEVAEESDAEVIDTKGNRWSKEDYQTISRR